VLVEKLAEGRAEGLAEGLAAGRAAGLAAAVIAVLEARGLALDAATRERILGERAPHRLDRWITSAATCPTLAALLAEL